MASKKTELSRDMLSTIKDRLEEELYGCPKNCLDIIKEIIQIVEKVKEWDKKKILLLLKWGSIQ